MRGNKRLDLVAIGRAAVDLYGEQLGSPLEDITTFKKSLGGCPANVSVGASRQGLAVAMITRVGDEHMGRFVRDTLAREGVDVRGVKTDPDRLTALVLLSIRSQDSFPLIFYRERCADMGLEPDDVEPELVASARALLVTGTHFSKPNVDATCRRAIEIARQSGTRVVFDIDYRPVLWGLTGHGAGESRFVESADVTRHLASILPLADLIVGTEEEILIAGGSRDALQALRAIRAVSGATVVLKRGREGCAIFEGPIPGRVEDGIVVPPVEVEVLNVLGAGDAFLAGFLRGWIRGEPLATSGAYGNASGALVVSRHGCAPAMPSVAELDAYLGPSATGTTSRGARIDLDPRVARLHRAALRRWRGAELCVLAFDHRSSLERVAEKVGAPAARLGDLKRLIARAAHQTAIDLGLGAPGARVAGMIVDDRLGSAALSELTGRGHWLARPIELPVEPGAPLALAGAPNVELYLNTWPREQVIKCLAHYHPDGPEHDRRATEAALVRLAGAAAALERELLIEVIPVLDGALDAGVLPRALAALYDLGVSPEWWKLPPPGDASRWRELEALIEARDPECEGILLLGLDAPEEELAEAFRAAAPFARARGFAVGRTIFGGAAEAWLRGDSKDDALLGEVGGRFARLVALWAEARGKA